MSNCELIAAVDQRIAQNTALLHLVMENMRIMLEDAHEDELSRS
jgi:hypothetical protein